MTRALTALLALGPALLLQVPRERVIFPPAGARVLVVERDDQGVEGWRSVRDAGANIVATGRPPSAAIDELAGTAGLSYLALLTTEEIEILARDESRVAAVRAQRHLAGFYYVDVTVPEGFETPETQRRAYSTLKQLFPDKLVLFPTRLDPIAWSPGYLDQYFRPEFTDLVTPYYYPVGTTIIGDAQEQDPGWSRRLIELLTALAYRVPPAKTLLPVLQGFEQVGYSVSAHFLTDQFAVYRAVWPNVSNAAVFGWKFSSADSAPLVEISGNPVLEEGVCSFFASLSRVSGCRSKRTLTWR